MSDPEEWARRFKQRLVTKYEFTEEDAEAMLATCTMEEWMEADSEPEDTADDNLSYW